MECPKCQFNNREGAKFCNECGHKFQLTCPDCGSNNRVGSKFCDECGSHLSVPIKHAPKDLSFDEKLTKIQKYLPKGLTEKILSQRDRIEGERKQVTVMFCDMEGFTPLTESLGIEEAYSVMDKVYEILIHKVHDYEGTVNEMTGDGIMALFGAPAALEDAPQRAIRSSLAIHREITKFSNNLKQEKENLWPIKMRIGIHTGPVVVGTVGNDLRVEFKAVGDTVNLASRMEGKAQPGTTYITEDTFRLTEGLFRFEALGEKEVKGKKVPVNVYRVIAPSTRRTRFDVNAERGLTPFVGRERELELLLDGFERAKIGRGQAFSVIAEAGVGKSRLLYEFRKLVADEDLTFLEGKCLSYSRGVAYHPVIDILKASFNVLENDRDSEIRQKVKKQLKILGADEASTLPYLLELLSVKDSGIDEIFMSPEAKKDRIMEAVKLITLKGSEIRPLILAVEDLHWVDKSSEDYTKNLLDSISGARIFLIFTYRPEFVHTWGGRSYHSQVNLNRLSNRESLAMMNQILDTDKIDRDLENLILEKTEGIPFFIEEFIRSLKDLKIIEIRDKELALKKDIHNLAIPSTIQDVIMARVDSLPDDAKETLQIGSAIEREFSFNLIKKVTALPEKKLLSNLSVLKDSELLYERGVYPQSTYIFKHALTREVVYDSILTGRKKKLHEQIGDAFEIIYIDNIIEHYGVISEHYLLSDAYEKGAKYSRLAGKQAQKRSSFTDAISYAKKGISCLEMLPQTDDVQRRIIDDRTALSNYCMGLAYHYVGMQAVAPIVDLAQKMNYKKRLPRIFVATGTNNIWVTEDIIKGIEKLNKAKKLAEKTEDFLSLWFACYFLGIAYWLDCSPEKSSIYFNMSLDLSIASNNATGICVAKSSEAAQLCVFTGKIDSAYKTCKESLELAILSGDIFLQQTAYSAFGACCLFKGSFEEAEENLSKAIAFYSKSRQAAWGGWAHFWLGELYFKLEDLEKAQHFYEQSSLIFEYEKLLPSWCNLNNLKLLRTKLLVSKENIHLESIAEFANKNQLKIFSGTISNQICGILLNSNSHNFSDAEKWITKAIKANREIGNIWWLAEDYVLYAKLLIRKGDHLDARKKMSKAIDIYKKCGADGWVEIYEKELVLIK
jgi:predicted ATPase/class 3 adenylate cyclase